MKYVVLRKSEFSGRESGYFEFPIAFDSFDEAKAFVTKWYEFLETYPCNGSATIVTLDGSTLNSLIEQFSEKIDSIRQEYIYMLIDRSKNGFIV